MTEDLIQSFRFGSLETVADVMTWIQYSSKLKPEWPYDPITPLLQYIPKGNKVSYNRDTCISMFIAALITCMLQNQPRFPSTDEWTNKMKYICIVEYYSSITIMLFAEKWSTWSRGHHVKTNNSDPGGKE